MPGALSATHTSGARAVVGSAAIVRAAPTGSAAIVRAAPTRSAAQTLTGGASDIVGAPIRVELAPAPLPARTPHTFPPVARVGTGTVGPRASVGSTASIAVRHSNPTPDYGGDVNVFAGTGAAGNTFPGPDLPFGMVQWSPDTTSSGAPSGYRYEDHAIRGFSLTHLSGSGCPIYEDIPFMPVLGAPRPSPAVLPAAYRSGFWHADETGAPGYYSVGLASGVRVELTATTRAGFGRFTYPRGAAATMLITTGRTDAHGQGPSTVRIDPATWTISGQASGGEFCGHTSNHYTVYFVAQFNRPFAEYGAWQGRAVRPGASGASGRGSGAYVSFAAAANPVVLARVGLSFVSIDGARANLAAEAPSGFTTADFDLVRGEAAAAWDRALGRIEVSGGSQADTRTFYTMLYHALLFPSTFDDADGRYIAFDGRVHVSVYPNPNPRARDLPYTQRANISGWDIYRTQVPLVTMLNPRVGSDIAQSLVSNAYYGGALPRWPIANNDTGTMVGDPADAIIAGAYAFGARGFNTQRALGFMVQGVRSPVARPNGVVERPDGALYARQGYIPQGPHRSRGGWTEATATTLEYATDDFALAQYARALGDTTTQNAAMGRAQGWQNIFDVAQGYIMPRIVDGTWDRATTPTTEMVEGDAAQYTWMAPFNLRRLFDLMGGPARVVARLNTFFTHLNTGSTSPYAWLGNEPTLGTPWEYDYAGAPWRTQGVVRRALLSLYGARPTGYPGNDDMGEMSSWYIFAALGFYPETPGSDVLALDSPLFPRVTLHLPGGDVRIVAPHASETTPYIQGVSLHGRPYTRPWLHFSVLAHGATLRFDLSATPTTAWGSSPSVAPPSWDDGTAAARRLAPAN